MKKTILFTLTLLLATYSAVAQFPTRVEPTFWWVGMQNPSLQLSMYGVNIAQWDFSLQYEGVSIEKKVLTDNPNYVFLYLQIKENTKPGKFAIKMSKDNKSTQFIYELKGRNAFSAERLSFSEADAVYLLMPDRFVNGELSNDSVPGYIQGVDRSQTGARHGGDIAGIKSKIPFIAQMGFTALWTTPLFDNNDKTYSYHHYGCSDYYKVDPRFGSNEDLVDLTVTANKFGIKMILDVVPNHCSAAHWWMKDLPAKNWFHTWPKYTGSNYRVGVWMDSHAANSDLAQLTQGWFAPNMPDFNLANPLVFDYLRQAYVFWIEYAGYQGIRVDTYPYNDIHLAADFIRSIRDEYPNMMVVGECWMNNPQEVAYFQSGVQNKDGFDSNLQSVMDFNLRHILATIFDEEEGWNSGVSKLYAHLSLDYIYSNENLIMNFVDNHDIERLSTHYQDVNKYKMALSVLTTLRGYPQIYAGTEVMQEGKAGSYEGTRFDYPGGWPGDTLNLFDPTHRSIAQTELYEHLTKLLHYRKNHSVLHTGKMKHFIPENGLYVYFRYNEDELVMVVVNNKEESMIFNSERFSEMLVQKTIAVDVLNNQNYVLRDGIEIPDKSVLIFEIR